MKEIKEKLVLKEGLDTDNEIKRSKEEQKTRNGEGKSEVLALCSII
jgi:hypothetical protein